jgi:hypothetical protein
VHGSRHAAAAALAEDESADRTWRRSRAEELFERYPSRFPSVSDAMAAVPDPVGGGGVTLAGSTDDIVASLRRHNPGAGWRNLGGELPDGAIEGIATGPGRGLQPADTRPPWQRG